MKRRRHCPGCGRFITRGSCTIYRRIALPEAASHTFESLWFTRHTHCGRGHIVWKNASFTRIMRWAFRDMAKLMNTEVPMYERFRRQATA